MPLREGSQIVEILHLDGEASRDFYERVHANDYQKSQCQKLVRDLFIECCNAAGGHVASNWAGDGGYALFPASDGHSGAIKAAAEFLSSLDVLAQQTATALSRGAESDGLARRFRIKAHRGEVYVSPDDGLVSGRPDQFDDFLKFEKNFAPVPNELFVTEQFHARLQGSEKDSFGVHLQEVNGGALRCKLYRLKATPREHARNLLIENDPEQIKPKEWRFLKAQLLSHRKNVAARNSITKGLIALLSSPEAGGQLDPERLIQLTIRALHSYLRSVYPEHQFSVSVWLPFDEGSGTFLRKEYAMYPEGAVASQRSVAITELGWKVVQAYRQNQVVVTSDVHDARNRGEWTDLAPLRSNGDRNLNSALQIPIYRSIRSESGNATEVLGVLSLDSDKPDMFLKEELDLWLEDLVGFLVNFALARSISSAA